MADSVTIERRFRGPRDSAHGGYACGLLARRVEAPGAAVSLRAPPPLDRPLEISGGEDGTAELYDGDRLLAEAASADPHLDLPEPVSLPRAEAASAACPWVDRHPFPGCFGCGPERSQEEAVAIQMGPVEGRDLFAAPWTPLAEFAGEDGAVAPLFVWSALDCPTAAAAVLTDTGPSVLARLEGRLLAPVQPGVTHTVVAWLLGHEGRKHRGAAAIYAPDGEPCAHAEGLWIELRDPTAMAAGA
jgi:hypothetical protein